MNDTERADVIREEIRRLESLRPDCARRLLRQDELRTKLDGGDSRVTAVLKKESTAFRLLDRLRQERNPWWEDHGTYVNDDDCSRLDAAIDLLLTLLREVDPSGGTPAEVDAALIRDAEAVKNLMIAVATGGPPINSVNSRYKQLRAALAEGLASRGISDPIPYDDLWQWYGKWSSGDLPTYQSRREFISDLFAPLLHGLRERETKGDVRVFTEATGWAKIDRNVGLMRSKLERATTELDYQEVGLACRETLIDLAQEVYNPELHPTDDGVDVSKTDARRMLDAYLSKELTGSSNENARRHAKASLALANELTHKRTAGFRDAALCAEATASIINIIAIVSGRRDP